MPKLSAIAPAHSQEVPVAIEGETVLLSVALHKVTPGLIVQMNKMSKKDDIAAILSFLQTTIDGWDITGEDDKPLPITEATLGSFPFGVLTALSQGVMDAVTSGNAASSPA